MDTTITLSLPEDIAAHLAADGEDLPRLALEAFGLQEYRVGRLSTAQLQRMLGFDTRWEVDHFLKVHGVELEYTPADLERDREAHAVWEELSHPKTPQSVREWLTNSPD